MARCSPLSRSPSRSRLAAAKPLPRSAANANQAQASTGSLAQPAPFDQQHRQRVAGLGMAGARGHGIVARGLRRVGRHALALLDGHADEIGRARIACFRQRPPQAQRLGELVGVGGQHAARERIALLSQRRASQRHQERQGRDHGAPCAIWPTMVAIDAVSGAARRSV